MNRIVQFALVVGALTVSLYGQKSSEALSSWPYFKEIRSTGTQAGLLEVVLDQDTLDKARIDEADLRLYDSAHREIAYALRVRREVDVRDDNMGSEYNRAVRNGKAQVSIDLGEQPREHNEVLVETAGNDFRRFADVEGSSDGSDWSILASKAVLFQFSADSRTVEQRSITYPVSRFRFLRISVDRDPQTDREAPEIKSVRVRRLLRMQGEYTQTMGLFEREPDRAQGRAASIWRIDFGARIPLQGIRLAPAEGDYSRPYQLEVVDDPATPALIASGELKHHDKPPAVDAAIDFEEQFARHLKLTITDDRNDAVHISRVTGLGAARQVIFEATAAGRGPLRLYYGNMKAQAPHYDLDARIPANEVVQLTRLALGPGEQNPNYVPEAKPFSERQPWVVYVVLLGGCAIVALLLLSISRASKAEPRPNTA